MEELKLKLTDMAHGGTAVGHDENKRPIFVPFGIPGELVRVDVTQDKERFARAELKAVVRSSPSRVEPRCQHFGVCGGCQWQHMSYDAQLLAKQAIVSDQMQRIKRRHIGNCVNCAAIFQDKLAQHLVRFAGGTRC